MALIQDGRVASAVAAVESKTKALRVTDVPRGAGYTLSATTGLIAAGQAAGSCFFAMRNSPSAGNYQVFIEKLRLQFTTVSAFTNVTSGRRLSIYRGTGAATSGGTALTPQQKDPLANLSNVASGQGGDARIATTGTLSVTGITWESAAFREMTVMHCQAATSNDENVYDFFTTSPIILQPGQLLGIRAPQAMDAGGTYVVSIDCDYHESVAYGSTVVD